MGYGFSILCRGRKRGDTADLQSADPDLEDCRKTLPQAAGKRIKIATIVYETRNRKPASFVDCQFWTMPFDRDGCFDKERRFEDTRLAMESFWSIIAPFFTDLKRKEDRTVIDIKGMSSRLRYERECKWSPTPEEWRKLNLEIEKLFSRK